jgi:hypothetical protein
MERILFLLQPSENREYNRENKRAKRELGEENSFFFSGK